MTLEQLLEEYKESNDRKQQILSYFLDELWKSKCKFRKYKRYYTYKIDEKLLDGRQDLIELFKKYNNIGYTVCKSFYPEKKLKSIDYIRIHINNMYGYLFDPDVYYNRKYYNLLATPKKEYFKVIKTKKKTGNIDSINCEEIKQNIEKALQEAELIKQNSIVKKLSMTFREYKQLINHYIEKIFESYIPIEEYEKRHGWNLKVYTDGWSEDNYIIKYFCKSLTGYMKNYISKIKSGKYIECAVCGKLVKLRSSRQKYCKHCAKEKERQRQRQKWHKYKHKYKSTTYRKNHKIPN